MVERSLTLGDALTTSWQTIRRYPALSIGGFVLFYALYMGMTQIPILGFLAAILVAPPFWGGFMVFTLHLVDRRDPKLEDIVEGFRAYGKWMGIYWLYTAISIAAFLPLIAVVMAGVFAVFLRSRALHMGGGMPSASVLPTAALLSFLALAFLAVGVAITIRWYFVYFAGIETPGVMDAFYKSAEITKGNRLLLVGLLILLGLIGFSGVLALGLGILFTLPLAHYAVAALYRQLNPRPEVEPPVEPLPGEIPPPALAEGTP